MAQVAPLYQAAITGSQNLSTDWSGSRHVVQGMQTIFSVTSLRENMKEKVPWLCSWHGLQLGVDSFPVLHRGF